MDSEVTYCICRLPYDVTRLMIQCDYCQDWFHTSCVGLQEHQANDLEKYHCPNCEGVRGGSLYRQRTNWHRLDYWEPNAEGKPVQTGTAIFIKELKTRHFPSCEGVVKFLKGPQFNLAYLQQYGFEHPIIFNEMDGLNMRIPEPSFDVTDVEKFVGPDYVLDVIDVARQVNIRMRLSEFVKYYTSTNRVSTLNAISLEFSRTNLASMVEGPLIARLLDWVNYVWPDKGAEDESIKPSVQKYCLMSMKDSFTDFHIDFGGSSVWYHVLWGEKVFYLIKPTPNNLSLYQRWQYSSTMSEDFFGDQVDMCYKCLVRQGQTMLIPTGWIHAVFTPVDTMVFGGNFLHSYNISLQLQVYEIEKKIDVPEKFLFPMFEAINWYAARNLLEEIKATNGKINQIPAPHLLQGIKALTVTLKQWLNEKDSNKKVRDIPACIEGYKICKELNKEVRIAERALNLLNPPKPERESKRRKKKPVNKDFVEYSRPEVGYETKQPLKLTIKGIKSMEPASERPLPRPPLKLTLPKPATYPYTSQGTEPEEKEADTTSPVLVENRRRPWTVVVPTTVPPGAEKPFSKRPAANKGTVLHLKLGPRDPDKKDSVYDFHDDSDDNTGCLMIDEVPKKTRRRYSITSGPSGSLKMKLPNLRAAETRDRDDDSEVDVVSDVPKNGIEELLKASGYTTEAVVPSPRLEEIDGCRSGRASPSTREAIAGMLSISRSFMSDTSKSDDHPTTARSRQKKFRFLDDYGENMDKVHQDEDYVYPTLDASDDEEVIFKPRGKRKLDEPWNPKARVGPLVPKTDRPTREGTKKQAVEKGLEAAAAKRVGMLPTKRPYNRKKVKPMPATPGSSEEDPAGSSSLSSTPSKKMAKIDLKSRKPRKGMATAKQRLGKILKIHKMKF